MTGSGAPFKPLRPLWVIGHSVIPKPGAFASAIEPVPGLVISIIATTLELHDRAQKELREAINRLEAV